MHMVFSAASFVMSKISFLIAMILPWKILAVASGAGSEYFNYFNYFDGLDVKRQVAYLGAIVVFIFIVHLLLEFIFDYLVSSGADRAILRNKKTGLFNNYRVFARNIYEHHVFLFSALLYSVLVFLFLFFYYPSLVVSFIFYFLFSLSLIYLFTRVFSFRVNDSSKWLSVYYKVWWHLGFVFALIWAINDYWKGVMPSLLISFVSLLLYRQVLVMMTIVFNSGYLIYKNRVRAGQIFSSAPNSEYQVRGELSFAFESLILDLNEQKWIDDICREKFSSLDSVDLSKDCQLVELGNVAYITVASCADKDKDGLLIKIYNTSREALAEQEIALLESTEFSWPFMRLLYSKRVNGFITLVCHWPAGAKWLEDVEKTASEPVIRNRLLAYELPVDIVEKYQHSQAGLFDRLKVVSWEHLESYSGVAASKVNWETVQDNLRGVLAEVYEIPKQLSINALATRMVFGSKEHPKLANVTRWAWEPLGSGWPLNRLKDLDQALAEAAIERAELVAVDPAKVNLVARIYEFERRYRNKNYAGAVNVLSILLKYYDETYLKESAAVEKPQL